MKKTLILLLSISLFYICVSNVIAETVKIPDDAIRIRVVPHSNDDIDQEVKGKVKTELETTMYNMLKDTKSSKEAKKIIKNNLNNIESDIAKLFIKEEYNNKFEITYGFNYFPEKKYKGVIYNEGYYESLLVTIGEGKGDNWWCILFPPLCLIEAEETSNIKYTTLVQKMIKKYSNNNPSEQ